MTGQDPTGFISRRQNGEVDEQKTACPAFPAHSHGWHLASNLAKDLCQNLRQTYAESADRRIPCRLEMSRQWEAHPGTKTYANDLRQRPTTPADTYSLMLPTRRKQKV